MHANQGNRVAQSNRANIVRRGSSMPFVFDLDGDDISDWICEIQVKRYTDDVSTIDRLIEPDNQVWPGFLTVAEINALDFAGTTPVTTGMHRLIGILTNTVTGEVEQDIIRFSLTDEWQN